MNQLLTIPELISIFLLTSLCILYLIYNNSTVLQNQLAKTKKTSYLSNILIGLIVVFCLIYPYCVAIFGLNFHDTFYDLNVFRNYHDYCSFATFGTTQLGYLFYTIAGGNVVFVQWISVFIFQVSIIIPLITLNKVRGYKFNSTGITLIAIISSVVISFSNIYMSYDTFTVLSMSLLLSVMICYEKHRSHLLLALAGIISGYSISLRFPNLMIVLFISLSFFLYDVIINRKWNGIIVIIEYCIFACVSYLLLCLIQYGTFGNMMADINGVMEGDESHGIVTMGKSYIYGFVDVSVFAGVVIFYYIANIYNNKKIKLSTAFVFMFVSLLLMYMNAGNCYHGIKLMMSGIVVSILLLMTIEHKDYFLALITFSCFILPIFGSNTGFLRLCNIVVLPFLIFVLMQYYNNRRIIMSLIIPIVLFLPVMIFSYTIVDDGIIHLNTQIREMPEIVYVRTTERRAQLVRDAQQVIDSEIQSGKKVVCIGSERHLFTYLNKLDDPFYEFSQNFDNEKFINKCMNLCQKDNNISFVLVKGFSEDRETEIEKCFNDQDIAYKVIYIDE